MSAFDWVKFLLILSGPVPAQWVTTGAMHTGYRLEQIAAAHFSTGNSTAAYRTMWFGLLGSSTRASA